MDLPTDFQPVYNMDLDQIYSKPVKYSDKEKAREVIENTVLRFGITRKQMRFLEERGLWEKFKAKWYEKRREQLNIYLQLCYCCNRPCVKYILICGRRLCYNCQKAIDRRMKT